MMKKLNVNYLSNISWDDVVECYKRAFPASSRAVILPKVIFIIHLIIRDSKGHSDASIQLHSGRLQDVLGNDYENYIGVLCSMGIISISSQYIIGGQCRMVKLLNWNIATKPYFNQTVIGYLKKWDELFKKHMQALANRPTIVPKMIDGQITLVEQKPTEPTEEELKFYKLYKDSLSCLNLKVNKKDVYEWIDDEFSNHQCHRYFHYIDCIDRFNKKDITIQSIDNQKRIYHFLTNLPKPLKQFFNLKISCDVANCHPLLFSKYLINIYNISNDILDILYNIEYKEYIIYNHNVTEYLIKNADIQSITDVLYKVPSDVLNYIYSASKGKIWDDFEAAFDGYTRDSIKSKAFSQIFYNDRDIADKSEFGKIFIEHYPNVYQAICDIKEVSSFPLLMMKFESKLIREVLHKFYDAGFKAVSIHDAVYILDIEQNSGVTADYVAQTMMAVFKKYGLVPTLHVDILA